MQRLGYALGAAYVGLIANAAGIENAVGSQEMPAMAIVLASLPLAALGLIGAMRFIRSAKVNVDLAGRAAG